MPYRFVFHILRTVDPSLGKIDKTFLSPQTVMELLIDGITNKEVIFESPEELTDFHAWDGLAKNDNGEIISINWEWFGLDGSLDLRWVPSTTEGLFLEGNCLGGSIDLTELPEGLEKIWLRENEFKGGVSLTMLPQTLETLDASHNYLNGSLDLTHLPDSMKNLYLQNNSFSSSVSLDKLPSDMRNLDLSDNPIEGETDFQHLPKSLEYFNISNTDLSGEITRANTSTIYTKGSEVTVANP